MRINSHFQEFCNEDGGLSWKLSQGKDFLEWGYFICILRAVKDEKSNLGEG